MTFYIATLGCKVNLYESNAIRAVLEKDGFVFVSENEAPDIIIVNSCTVTAESDRKTRQTVRKLRKKVPDSVIVLTGCMSQACHEKAENMLEVDIVTGNRANHKIPELINEYFSKHERIVYFEEHEKDEEIADEKITDFYERTRAFLKIEDGCENFCSYCIIPKSKGYVRSKSLEKISAETENLAQNGYKEIVLVGINLSAYGKGTEFDLTDAVYTVSQVDGIERIRLGSIEPDLMTDEFMEKLAQNKKFCPQFHLSLQSGCDETLKRMNRHYDTAFYRDLVKRIRNKFNNPSITTDIMVGFAGETDEEFEKSLEFANEMAFARAHVFIYSRREHTVAGALKNQVEKCVAEARSKRLIAVTNETEKAFLKSQTGKVSKVLFESTLKNGYHEGYTENYTRVLAKSDEDVCNKIYDVKLTSTEDDFCYGEIIK